MKAIRVHDYGGLDVLRYEEVPIPEPGPGHVRTKIEAAGVNFIDIYHRTGLYPNPRPFIPGIEAAGVVDAVGPDVTDVRVGDRVAYILVLGAYAERAVVPAEKLIPLPEGIDFTTAAAAMVQGLTAHYLTHSTYPLGPQDTALVHAAAGGTGSLLVQMAKRRGARVIATVSTEEKARRAREVGADHVILYTQSDFEVEVKRLTEGRGVDVVYDSVGQATFEKSLNCLRPRGYLVLFGQSSGPVPPLDPLILSTKGSLFMTRPHLMHYTATREELLERARDLFQWIHEGQVTIRIERIFPLAEAAEAHRMLAERRAMGKILLTP